MKDNPRPCCAECGQQLDPAHVTHYPTTDRLELRNGFFYPTGSGLALVDRPLEGLYCLKKNGNCILDAIKRGYPLDRTRP